MIPALLALMFLQSVDDVVARAVEARGGIKKIKALNSQRLTGTISLAGGSSGPFVVEMKRPSMLRESVTLGNKSMIRTTNGDVGWVVGSLRDVLEPQQVNADELRNLAANADFEGPLVDHKDKGNRIELAGKEKIGKRPAYKLVIYMKNGENRLDFIDCKTYLEVKWQGLIGGDLVESYFQDYRPVKGLMYAFEIDSGKQKIVLQNVEVNPKLDPARFEKPQ
ncbi:MAG TPA: hypothetical protein VNU44_03985 [Bryobacteraceae bacterium]|nr:hypothetical protein [Bryobacteraceae bacterium]